MVTTWSEICEYWHAEHPVLVRPNTPAVPEELILEFFLNTEEKTQIDIHLYMDGPWLNIDGLVGEIQADDEIWHLLINVVAKKGFTDAVLGGLRCVGGARLVWSVVTPLTVVTPPLTFKIVERVLRDSHPLNEYYMKELTMLRSASDNMA